MRERSSWRLLIIGVFAAALVAAACGNSGPKVRALGATADQTSSATATSPTVAVPSGDPTVNESPAAPDPAATFRPDGTEPQPLTPAPSTPTVAVSTPDIEATATVPPPCRSVRFGPGETLTQADLDARGLGTPLRSAFVGTSLVIRRIGVDARFVVRVVGPDGKMPRVGNATDVAWYDFSQWSSLGGSPGTDHGNVVIAGDYDDQGVPQAVFFRLSELVPGDLVQINTSDGRTLAYEVEFNKTTSVDGIDWGEVVAATPEESITLITAAAALNQGRRVVWGRAVDTGCTR
ncbi:MAG: sortase [Chloroflexi bacterium]|nr:sortase [Chloroflexota bacterium]